MDIESTGYKMFSSYLDELQSMCNLPLIDDKRKEFLFSEIQCYEFSKWVNVIANGNIVGFFIIGTGENCHPDADYYIQEAYIQPEYRRKGYMSYAISEYVKRHRGIYCLLILNKNYIAKTFWPEVFRKLGYMPRPLSDVGATDEDCQQYGFEPKIMS